MGYTVVAGLDGAVDVWELGVLISGCGTSPINIILDPATKTPAGCPIIEVTRAGEGGATEEVLPGGGGKFYTVEDAKSKMTSNSKETPADATPASVVKEQACIEAVPVSNGSEIDSAPAPAVGAPANKETSADAAPTPAVDAPASKEPAAVVREPAEPASAPSVTPPDASPSKSPKAQSSCVCQ